ncbi:hypothetical protein [Acholeplasma palmae]|uniref:hypothetical protein n=1 Tax=Acholeplasma palmae TaxID=38986 RepID=UPI000ABC7E23|nr:hypothetical protein [Alteracholeplasma palmae]
MQILYAICSVLSLMMCQTILINIIKAIKTKNMNGISTSLTNKTTLVIFQTILFLL